MTEQEWEQVINSVDLVIIDDIQMVEDEGNRFVKERMDYLFIQTTYSYYIEIGCIIWKANKRI